MIFWVCGAITLSAAAWATFSDNTRRAVLALWVAGLGAGGVFLSVGAELLAMVQWVLSTLTAAVFLFYCVVFGEPGQSGIRERLQVFPAVVIGCTFSGLVFFGVQGIEFNAPDPKTSFFGKVSGAGLSQIGHYLVSQHILSLEVLTLTLFLVLVGAGVLARPEKKAESVGAATGVPVAQKENA